MPSDGAFGLVRLIITTWGGFHRLFFFFFKRKFPLAALARPLLSGPHPPPSLKSSAVPLKNLHAEVGVVTRGDTRAAARHRTR